MILDPFGDIPWQNAGSWVTALPRQNLTRKKLAGPGTRYKTHGGPHCTKIYSGRNIFSAPDCLLVESGRKKTNLNFCFYLYFYELFIYLQTCL